MSVLSKSHYFQIAILARDLKRKQQGYVLEPDTSARTATSAPRLQPSKAKPTPLKPQTFADMKAELFGSSGDTGGGERLRKQRVEEREGASHLPRLESQEGSGLSSEVSSQVTVDTQLGGDEGEEVKSKQEGAMVEAEEGEGEESEEDDPYGGMLR